MIAARHYPKRTVGSPGPPLFSGCGTTFGRIRCIEALLTITVRFVLGLFEPFREASWAQVRSKFKPVITEVPSQTWQRHILAVLILVFLSLLLLLTVCMLISRVIGVAWKWSCDGLRATVCPCWGLKKRERCLSHVRRPLACVPSHIPIVPPPFPGVRHPIDAKR